MWWNKSFQEGDIYSFLKQILEKRAPIKSIDAFL
jgi:hypothetical protein